MPGLRETAPPPELRRAAPQWWQATGEESAGTGSLSASGDALDAGCHSDTDLQAMVRDFIEDGSAECKDGADGDGASPILNLGDTLQVLAKPHGAQEREVLTAVQRIVANAGLACDCYGTCVKRFVVERLRMSAAICTSAWSSAGCVPGGEYEYIAVSLAGERMIVDIGFRAQFEIARPTPQYTAALASLPAVFVGTAAKLEQILRLMSEATKASLEQSGMHVPPWRTLDYMRSKWLSTGSPSSLPRRARQCGDDLRRSKRSQHIQARSSSNLPRRRSSRASVFVQPAA